MERKAGLIDAFAPPYEVWTRRRTSIEEAMDLVENKGVHISQATEVNDKLVELVSTPIQAATRMLKQGADTGLEHHVEYALDSSARYQALRKLMPTDEPEALSSYQGSFTERDWVPADEAIKANGVEMADGQFLFHGGVWSSDSQTITTTRPFSTSFCPQVALRNAEWDGKAYASGRIDLMVVRVTRPQTMAYAYSREGEHGHEKEVVFASGAKLRRVRQVQVGEMRVSDFSTAMNKKVVPTYLVEVELS
ncbi:hypothetical protein GIV49_04335 [Pseudomonas syringae]|uniref:hypothetical protein n=1 Tax=Pseudomonas syringae TaxID=317 RepID=UPI001F1CB557|nr:hypothetical protein [Pseudomonas syringae]MCF5648813.1 hypothetical protein [Pseudomonas syringae]